MDAVNDVVTVADESGHPVALQVDANTQFYFRRPQAPAADAAPIGTGTGFLASQNLVRGFKVHASVVDPLASPLVAQSIDIETAVYDGRISGADLTGFTYTRNFRTATDDYVHPLAYIAATTANGTDDSGAAISGYKWWNFAYPSLLQSGADAVPQFVSATSGGVDFGGTVGAVPARAVSFAVWGDPAAATGWSAAASVLLPSLLPLGSVATGLVNGSFTADRARRRRRRRRRRERHRGFGDAGLSSRQQQRHRHRQSCRYHQQRRTCHRDRRVVCGHAGQGVWHAAGRWDVARLCRELLHRGSVHAVSAAERCAVPPGGGAAPPQMFGAGKGALLHSGGCCQATEFR